jgi:hypothetical protein
MQRRENTVATGTRPLVGLELMLEAPFSLVAVLGRRGFTMGGCTAVS